MKARVLLLAILVPVLLAGCGKGEEAPGAQIIPLPQVTAAASRFAEFPKLPVVTAEPDPDGVSFKSIGFAADDTYIMVQFTAPQSQSGLWQQDYIYVVDEKTRAVFKDIPVMPVVGPLMGRPSQEGQVGYVMLINYRNGIKSGSVVTVVLGKYKREHVTVP